MKVKDFYYELPSSLIAQFPAEPRESAKLLQIIPPSTFIESTVAALPELVTSQDVLVLNNTKVLPTRLHGSLGGKNVEVTLHKQLSEKLWWAFAKPSKYFLPGEYFWVNDAFQALILDKQGSEVLLDFQVKEGDFLTMIDQYGAMPLPPYIKRKNSTSGTINDLEAYQTIYATQPGAVAAPTAGLHLTSHLLAEIQAKGTQIAYVTLHVGAGTFLPVKSEHVHEHKMHTEYCHIAPEEAEKINAVRQKGGRVIAVGTTSLRTLESAALPCGRIQPLAKQTDIFIYPPYQFRAVDVLLTNFHLPSSTLLMLVSAFAGKETILNAYDYAIQKKYRFFSYGDACFIHRAKVD